MNRECVRTGRKRSISFNTVLAKNTWSRRQILLTSTSIWLFVIGSDFYLIRKFWVQISFTLLSQRISGDCLERLLHIDILFSTGFKVWYVPLALAPALGSCCRNLGKKHAVESHAWMTWSRQKQADKAVWKTYCPSLQVNLVAQHYKGKVFWVPRTGLNEKFVPPTVQRLETLSIIHVEYQNTTVCAAIEGNT